MARILLAIDGSEAAALAARRAVELLGTDHEYIALSVVRASMIASSPGPITSALPGSLEVVEEPDPDPEAVLAASQRAETEALDDLEVATRTLHVKLQRRVEMGDPGETIARIVETEHVSVVVLGSHGKRRALPLRVGSVSRHVIKHTKALALVLGAQAL